MLRVQLQPNVRLPHSAALGQRHQFNARPVTRLRNVLPTRVARLHVQANGRVAAHLAYLALVGKGMPLQPALGHALALKCAANLNGVPL